MTKAQMPEWIPLEPPGNTIEKIERIRNRPVQGHHIGLVRDTQGDPRDHLHKDFKVIGDYLPSLDSPPAFVDDYGGQRMRRNLEDIAKSGRHSEPSPLLRELLRSTASTSDAIKVAESMADSPDSTVVIAGSAESILKWAQTCMDSPLAGDDRLVFLAAGLTSESRKQLPEIFKPTSDKPMPVVEWGDDDHLADSTSENERLYYELCSSLMYVPIGVLRAVRMKLIKCNLNSELSLPNFIIPEATGRYITDYSNDDSAMNIGGLDESFDSELLRELYTISQAWRNPSAYVHHLRKPVLQAEKLKLHWLAGKDRSPVPNDELTAAVYAMQSLDREATTNVPESAPNYCNAAQQQDLAVKTIEIIKRALRSPMREKWMQKFLPQS